jgi:hypothetical protein
MSFRFRTLLSLVAAGAVLAACGDDPTLPARGTDAPPAQPPRSLGLVEITLTGVGTPNMTASVTPVGGTDGPNLTLVPVSGGTPAGSIQMRRASATTVDTGTRGVDGVRYLQAVFEVRNADQGGNAYDTPRQNLTFIPVGTAAAVPGTPVSRFFKQDGTPADPAIAGQLRPTGAVALDGGGTAISQYPDVLQALTESEVASFAAPDAVTERFPYGFVVRHATDPTTRTLPGEPLTGQFDGRVTFAYKIPLQPNPADDPFTISVFALAVDDSETRVTQSPEEQTAAGRSAFEARAASLNADEVVVLAGGSYTGSIAVRAVCSVRTGGTSGAPTGYLQDASGAAAVGSVVHLSAAEAAAFCVPGGAAGAEYTLMPLNTGASSVSLSVTGTGIAGVTGPPTPNRLPGRQALFGGTAPSAAVPDRDHAFDLNLRAWERRSLRTGTASKSGVRSAPAGPLRTITPGVPALGDLMDLNVAQGCSGAPDMRTGRVRSIGTNIVIVADTSNPAGGFTTAQYDSIRMEFDTIAYAAITPNFGTPTDIDGNGRVVVFFTRAVNELSPPASSVTTYSYFAARDLQDPATCERSNGGEMIYALVPDPVGTVNSNARSVFAVRGNAIRTLGHDLQHLVNASRRIHVTGAPLEEAWLDEGMSKIAEEMMFYRTSFGIEPRQNIVVSNLNSGPLASRRVAAFNTYANTGLFTAFRPWLQRPDTSGAFKDNGALAAGGAAWAFLRYAADRAGGTESAFWSALVNGTGTGKANLQAAFGADPNVWLRDFVVATYADDAVAGIAPEHQHPSWNFRSMYVALGGSYQLVPRPLTSGVPLTLAYSRDGGAAFTRFSVPANGTATFSVKSGGAAPPSTTTFSLIRTK